jgi:hypothetical protein
MKIHALAVLIALGAFTFLGSAPAVADNNPQVWKATVVPTSGSDSDAPALRTSGACPFPARSLIGRIYGAGFPVEGVNVIGNNSGSVSMATRFEMPLQESLRDTRVRQPRYTPYKGVYTIKLSCIIPAYVDRSYGDFVARIKFTSPTHWVAMRPVTQHVGVVLLPDGQYAPANEVPASLQGSPDVQGSPTDIAGQDPAAGASPGTPDAAHPAAGADSSADGSAGDPADNSAAPEATETVSSGGGLSGTAWVLIAGGVLVALATVLIARTRTD